MKIDIFNGGLSTRVKPHLIQINEGVKYNNIDNSQGSLVPAKKDSDIGMTVGKTIFNFQGKWVFTDDYSDFVEFQSRLYVTHQDGTSEWSEDGVNWNKLGIQQPPKPMVNVNINSPRPAHSLYPMAYWKPTTTFSAIEGNLPQYPFRYLIVFSHGEERYSYEEVQAPLTPQSGIKVEVSSMVGGADLFTLYRLWGSKYRKVGSTPGLFIEDRTHDLENAEVLEDEFFQFKTKYYYAHELTDSNGNRAIIKYDGVSFEQNNFPEEESTTGRFDMEPTTGYTETFYFKKGTKFYRCPMPHYNPQQYEEDITLVDLPRGIYQYCYTYYNSRTGHESAPSEYSDEIEVDGTQVQVHISASLDPQVDKIRIYRIGGDLIEMVLVEEVDNITGTYLDNLSDLEVEGTALWSFNNKPAPPGLRYLTIYNAMFFGAVDNRLRYSDIAEPLYWSDFYDIPFDEEITGLGPTQNGLLVFTRHKTYIVTGNAPNTLSRYLLSAEQGCIHHRSIAFLNNMLLWQSNDGVCASAGGDIRVLTFDKLGKISTWDNYPDGVSYEDVYYLSYENGTLALDFRFGPPIIKTYDLRVDDWEVYADVLYYSKDNRLYSFGTSTNPRTLTYKSPDLTEGSITNLKNYKDFYVMTEGQLAIRIYIDDKEVYTGLISGFKDIKIPQEKRRGYKMSYEIYGTGILLEIEYKVEVRQNGR